MPLHPNRLEALAKKVQDVSSLATPPMTPFARRRNILGYEGSAWSFVDGAADKYDHLVDEFYIKLDWMQKYSKKFTDLKVRELVSHAIDGDSTEDLSKRIGNINTEYEDYSLEQTIFIPLSGIKVESEVFEMGQIQIRRITPEFLQTNIDIAKAIIDLSTNATSDKEYFKNEVDENIREAFVPPGAVAEYKIIARPDRAFEIARNKVSRVLDVLRCSIPLLHHRSDNVKVGFIGEANITFRAAFAIDSVKQGFNLDHSRSGPYRPLVLNERTYKTMEQHGLIYAVSLFEKPEDQLSKIEEAYVRAMHWLSDAERQVELENKVLSLVTCLETFFTPSRDSGLPISNTVAESIALLAETELEKRRHLKKMVKNLYNLRSRVSHGGGEIVDERDLMSLLDVAYWVIHYFYDKRAEYNSLEDVSKKVEDLKLQ